MVDDSKAVKKDEFESPSFFSIVFHRSVSLRLKQRQKKNPFENGMRVHVHNQIDDQ